MRTPSVLEENDSRGQLWAGSGIFLRYGLCESDACHFSGVAWRGTTRVGGRSVAGTKRLVKVTDLCGPLSRHVNAPLIRAFASTLEDSILVVVRTCKSIVRTVSVFPHTSR